MNAGMGVVDREEDRRTELWVYEKVKVSSNIELLPV